MNVKILVALLLLGLNSYTLGYMIGFTRSRNR